MFLVVYVCLSVCVRLHVINKVKVTYHSQNHTSRSRSNKYQGQNKVIFKQRCSYTGGLHLNQMRSSYKKLFQKTQLKRLHSQIIKKSHRYFMAIRFL